MKVRKVFMGAVVFWWAASFAIHPFGAVKKVSDQGEVVDGLAMPAQVRVIVQRSCQDCHSTRTTWPWYSYVAPVSWLVESDVRHGRDHLNLSEWPKYTFAQRQDLLAAIATAVQNNEMPMAKYTMLHHAARLSETDKDSLTRWAGSERRKMKAQKSKQAGNIPGVS